METKRCVRCIQNELRLNPDFDVEEDNVRYNHSPMSIKCPLKSKHFNRTIVNP
jgi:hypothetical protein